MAASRSAIFLDKDGTVLEDVPFNVDPARMRLAPGARDALAMFGALPEVALIVVSNQSGIAHGYFAEDAMKPVVRRLRELFADCGARLGGFYYCPHHPAGSVERYARSCVCRKPLSGMFEKAAARHRVSLRSSWLIGDILDDVEAGRRAGCTTMLIHNGNETEWKMTPARQPHYSVARIDDAARIILDRMHAAGRECAA